MKVDTIIKDIRRTLEQVVKALAHGLSASDNLSGQGSTKDQVLHSTGPNTPPEWTDASTVVHDGGGGPPFKPLDADDLTSGTVPAERLQGNYPGVTGVGVLLALQVDGAWMHSQTISRDTTIPAGWGSPLVGPIDVALGVTFDIAGVVEILG